MIRKLKLPALLLLSLFQLLLALPGLAQNGPFVVDVSNRESVRTFYRNFLLPLTYDPGWTGNFDTGDPGTTSQAYRDALLLRVNAFRALAGVYSDVTENAEYSRKAQAAALMQSVNFYSGGGLNHFPPPTWAYYTPDAAAGSANSNLFLYTHLGDPVLPYINEGIFANDAGFYAVGHRQALLNPRTRHIGIGTVPSRFGSATSRQYDSVNALWINDETPGAPSTRDGFVAWPPAGYIPNEFIDFPWSFAAFGNLASADFSQATISMSLNGTPLPITAVLNRTRLSLVWTPANIGTPDQIAGRTSDQIVDVTIKNVSGAADVHYRVIGFNPAVGPGSSQPPAISWQLISPFPVGSALSKVRDANGYSFAVGEDGVILRSAASGVWQRSTVDPNIRPFIVSGVAFGNGRYVAFGGQSLLSSTDGLTWTSSSFAFWPIADVIYANGWFIAVSRSETIWVSRDGVSWQQRSANTPVRGLGLVCFGNGTFVTVASDGTIFTSSDALNWIEVSTSPATPRIVDLAFGVNTFVAVAAGGIIVSDDGVQWKKVFTNSLSVEVTKVAYGPSGFLAIGIGSSGPWIVLRSDNGTDWEQAVTVGLDRTLNLVSLTWSGGRWITVGTNGTIASSSNSVDWHLESTKLYDGGAVMAFGNGRFLGVSRAGEVISSIDGVAWESLPQTTGDLRGVSECGVNGQLIFANGQFVLSGFCGVFTSTSGQVWKRTSTIALQGIAADTTGYVGFNHNALYGSATLNDWNTVMSIPTDSAGQPFFSGIMHGNGIFVAAGFGGILYTSTDGVSWVARKSSSTDWILRVAYGARRFVATTLQGSITSDDGINWQGIWSYGPPYGVDFVNGAFYEFHGFSVLSTSADGQLWQQLPVPFPIGGGGMIFGNGRFVAYGGESGVMAGIVAHLPRRRAVRP